MQRYEFFATWEKIFWLNGKKIFAEWKIMCIFAIDFNGEITKRYARSADRNVGTFYSKAESV
jgi:hypothetical protein